MKFGLLVVITIVAGAWAASFLLEDPGYIVVQFRGYLVEMSVPALLGLFALLLFALWSAAKLWRAPRRLGEAAGRYRAGRAGERLTRGMIEVAEGNLARGERLLARSADVSEAPLANYLQAARAAHLLGRDRRRDDWLKEAYERMPDAANAVLLTQAELQLERAQHEQALATLRRIEANSPNHSHALALLGRVYFRLEDWQELGALLPRIRKYGRVDRDTLERWALRVQREKLAGASDAAAVDEVWQQAPRELKKHPELVEAYVVALLRSGQHDKAEKTCAAALKRNWHAGLVRAYGRLEASDPVQQLKRAERWLSAHGEDPDLLLTCARICLRNELWGKARSYLESALAIRPSPEAYQDYGRLLHQLGEGEAAAAAYRAGLGLVAPVSAAAIPWLGPEAAD